jgi:Na+/H+ antiporter NhaD/arsenite permease-like protein
LFVAGVESFFINEGDLTGDDLSVWLGRVILGCLCLLVISLPCSAITTSREILIITATVAWALKIKLAGAGGLRKTGLELPIVLFILAYLFIITEKTHRTKIALMGGVLLVVFHVLTQSEAFDFIDFNTIGLLSGMMLLISVLKETGVFSWFAIKIAKKSGGNPWRILLLFSVFTAIASALLDNVTTVLLIAPITILIAEMLDITPFPFLIAEIIASNIGGTSTLIGDPPNILIGSASGLSFLDFILHLGPIALLILAVTLLMLKVIFRKQLASGGESMRETIESMDETKVITDHVLLKRSMIVLGLTVVGFLVHGLLGLEPATIALAGGGALLIWSGTDVEKRLKR